MHEKRTLAKSWPDHSLTSSHHQKVQTSMTNVSDTQRWKAAEDNARTHRARTQASTHARTHARTYTHTHTHTHKHTRARARASTGWERGCNLGLRVTVTSRALPFTQLFFPFLHFYFLLKHLYYVRGPSPTLYCKVLLFLRKKTSLSTNELSTTLTTSFSREDATIKFLFVCLFVCLLIFRRNEG